jgi:hypothetical protein
MSPTYPTLRIHVWGGLGSQLFAVAAAFDISKRFPKRKIALVLHSSGVTKRKPEVCEIFPELRYLEIDDFSSREHHDSKTKALSIKTILTRILRPVAFYSGFLAEENENESRATRRWTLSVRGHYFHRKISSEFIKELNQRLELVCDMNIESIQVDAALHYRLGDLLELSNKNSVDVNRIVSTFSSLNESDKITILSDSPEKALSLIRSASNRSNLQIREFTTLNTVFLAANAKSFIGTSSKVSYWIIMLRVVNAAKSKNFMPQEDSRLINVLYECGSSVEYY